MTIIVNRYGQDITSDYNEVTIETPEESLFGKSDFWIAKKIGEELVKHYPGRQWGVQVDQHQGYIILTCPSLSLLHGYYLHIKGDTISVLQQRAVLACGEVLERYNVSRNRKFDSDILETLPRDFRDEVISADAIPDSIKKGIRS